MHTSDEEQAALTDLYGSDIGSETTQVILANHLDDITKDIYQTLSTNRFAFRKSDPMDLHIDNLEAFATFESPSPGVGTSGLTSTEEPPTPGSGYSV